MLGPLALCEEGYFDVDRVGETHFCRDLEDGGGSQYHHALLREASFLGRATKLGNLFTS